MVRDIEEAAIRVLDRDGIARFTTIAVAAAAGISVGSLYQYFPDKKAILYALQRRAVERAWHLLVETLDGPLPPAEKIAVMARHFFAAESEEVRRIGSALRDADILVARTEAFAATDRAVAERFAAFLAEVPEHRRPRRDPEGDAAFLIAVLDAMGRHVAGASMPVGEIVRWANRTTRMLCHHLGIHPVGSAEGN